MYSNYEITSEANAMIKNRSSLHSIKKWVNQSKYVPSNYTQLSAFVVFKLFCIA